METRASYVMVGGFVLALIATAFAFVIFLARGQFEEERRPYLVNFLGSVTGLEVGSPVRYRGVPVGRVSSIRIDPDDLSKIRVVAEIVEGTPIKEDTVASLGLQGITGVAYVNLTGGTQASPTLRRAQGQEYAEIRVAPSSLEKVLEDLPKLFERAVEVSERLASILDEKNRGAIADTLDNVRKLTGELANRTGSIDRLIDEAAETATALRRTAEGAERVVARIDARTGPITDDAMKTLVEARKASESFARAAQNVDRIVAENRQPIHDFSTQGLYELSQFLIETRALVASLTQLTESLQRDPARFLFGDQKKGFEAR